jgi:hypothetical protein
MVCGLRVPAGQPVLYGPFWAWPGQCGPSVTLLPCPVGDHLSVVEGGSYAPLVSGGSVPPPRRDPGWAGPFAHLLPFV